MTDKITKSQSRFIAPGDSYLLINKMNDFCSKIFSQLFALQLHILVSAGFCEPVHIIAE